MKTAVYLINQSEYHLGQIENRLREAFSALGVADIIKPGNRVLLKPNLLMAVPPERHVTTHPVIVEAVVRLLIDLGVQCAIGDSPGVENTKSFIGYDRTLEVSGIKDVVNRYNIDVIRFSQSFTPSARYGHLFRYVKIAKEATEFNAIVNIPKLKTHVQTQLTLCVKNMFGCVIGAQKAQWHLTAGKDHETFARIITEIYDLVRPSLNILDGIYCMEGDGPTNGDVRHGSLIGVSADGVALDRVICGLVHMEPRAFNILKAAKEIGCGETELDNIELSGDTPKSFDFSNFKFPRTIEVRDMGPAYLQKYLERLLRPRIKISHRNCALCGNCVDVCPAKALTKQNGSIKIDHSECIHCFCCHEMCKYKAIDIDRSWLARLISYF